MKTTPAKLPWRLGHARLRAPRWLRPEDEERERRRRDEGH